MLLVHLNANGDRKIERLEHFKYNKQISILSFQTVIEVLFFKF